MLKNITLYKTPVCPYCQKAITLFEKKNVADKITEIDITKDPAFLDEMLNKTGGKRTVPQIFIDDKYIGGCDDLYDLDDQGELDKLLK